MSLSTQGKVVEAERRATAREAAERERERQLEKARGALFRAMRGERFEVSYLETIRELYPKRATGDFNPRRGQIVWDDATVYRFKVDDVIVRVWDEFRVGWEVSPEVPCRECGRKISPREAESPYAGYESSLVEAVGKAQGTRWLCKHCALELPEECAECGRAFRRC